MEYRPEPQAAAKSQERMGPSRGAVSRQKISRLRMEPKEDRCITGVSAKRLRRSPGKWESSN